MYQIENQRQAVEGTSALGSSQGGRPKVSRNVVFLGLNSFLTDISSEMVSTVLPLYLMFTLRSRRCHSGSSTASTKEVRYWSAWRAA